jgi:hypothetical protein
MIQTLAKDMPRWLRLEEELKRLAQVYPYLKRILALGGPFKERFNRQTSPIH